MFSIRLIALIPLCFSQWTLANYDPEKIKNTISNNPEIFQVSDWDKQGTTWNAITSQRWMSISISQQQSELISPYLNAKQVAKSKARCLTLAVSGLSIDSEQDKDHVLELINASSQHHRLKYLDMNGARFEVSPKLVGAFVRLFCTVKPSA